MMAMRNRLLIAIFLIGVAGCATPPKLEDIPPSGTILPSDGKVQVTSNISYTYEELLLGPISNWAINQLWNYPLNLYFVYQPFAKNWTMEEAVLDPNTYYVRLQAKRFRTGGDGEAMSVLKRRATQIQHEHGFTGYRILDYSEGIESNTIGAQKYSEGIIQFARAGAPAAR
jgi:hypothetical protein